MLQKNELNLHLWRNRLCWRKANENKKPLISIAGVHSKGRFKHIFLPCLYAALMGVLR